MAKWEELPIADLEYRGIIYKYISPSNKVYIGQTINEKNRKRQHKQQALKGKVFTFIKQFVNMDMKTLTMKFYLRLEIMT